MTDGRSGRAGLVALAALGRRYRGRLASLQPRVLLPLVELLGRDEAGRRGAAAGAARVRLLAPGRLAVEALDRAERDRAGVAVRRDVGVAAVPGRALGAALQRAAVDHCDLGQVVLGVAATHVAALPVAGQRAAAHGGGLG